MLAFATLLFPDSENTCIWNHSSWPDGVREDDIKQVVITLCFFVHFLGFIIIRMKDEVKFSTFCFRPFSL